MILSKPLYVVYNQGPLGIQYYSSSEERLYSYRKKDTFVFDSFKNARRIASDEQAMIRVLYCSEELTEEFGITDEREETSNSQASRPENEGKV